MAAGFADVDTEGLMDRQQAEHGEDQTHDQVPGAQGPSSQVEPHPLTPRFSRSDRGFPLDYFSQSA
ncbi:hypothetical protein QRX50_36425 [Amycolatopsis carbonis]|uniref:Uncharacterized protein n=1 Tax=Amycolatopsis carbonis TaxID=715471 RepID=A0A9Y2MVM0_9PSEU|nr:hypothetical protein [Amycolatopsis sp. 2-15]WIX76872.1 hypothetical protein QRX50_36425 [Amycolatopsis sp. 2-15]